MSTSTNPMNNIPPEPLPGDAGARLTGWRRALFGLKLIEVRMRFVLILIISGALIGYWDVIKNYYDKYTRPASKTAAAAIAHQENEWFCPMHTFIVRDHFDKCPVCGMDLVKRKKGEKPELPAGVVARVQVSPAQIAEAGVKTEPVVARTLAREIRAVGEITPSESLQQTIANRFPGRVEKLLVNYVGAHVKKGDPVAQIYSAQFLAAAKEYVLALNSRTPTGASLVNAARNRLLLAGFTEQQVDEIARKREVPRLVTYYSPIEGTVLEKRVNEGQYVEEGTALLSVADLSRVWAQANVLESDIGQVRIGQPVDVRSVAFPGAMFVGNVSFIYPSVEAESRSVKVRIEISNESRKLRPGMYVTANIRLPVGGFEPLEPPDLSRLPAFSAAAHAASADTQQPETETTGVIYAAAPSGVKSLIDSSADREWEEGYTCVMHPEHLAEQPGICNICDCGMHYTKWRRQKVLSVPENAVIDTGTRKFVYVEQASGVFDAHRVELGPRTGDWYPVLSGLKSGMEIATAGSFLLDAENRLNPASDMNKPDEGISARAAEATVVVKSGYSPEVLEIGADQPRRIVFDRREDGVCSSQLVIPSLGIKKDLAAFGKTVIELPAHASGEIPYACGMDMLHGKLVVRGGSSDKATTSSAAAAAK